MRRELCGRATAGRDRRSSTGRAAVDLARRWHPDTVLMDLNMPEMNGLAATRLPSVAYAMRHGLSH
jgi:CheY-like chemotaxis protein